MVIDMGESEKYYSLMNIKKLKCGCHGVNKNGHFFSKITQISKKGQKGFKNSKSKKWKKLTPVLGQSGYLQIALHGKTLRLNRVIAMTFVKNIFNKPECHHIDGNKLNNKVSNLRWGTQKENAADRRIHGNWDNMIGSKNHNAKLNEEKIKCILNKRKKGLSLQFLANEFGVSKKLILLITQRKIWRHV